MAARSELGPLGSYGCCVRASSLRVCGFRTLSSRPSGSLLEALSCLATLELEILFCSGELVKRDFCASGWERSVDCAATSSIPALFAISAGGLWAAGGEVSERDCVSRLTSSAASFRSVTLSRAGCTPRIRVTAVKPTKVDMVAATSVWVGLGLLLLLVPLVSKFFCRPRIGLLGGGTSNL